MFSEVFSCYFSLLVTATGHIKLTDFGLSKIGLMSCKYTLTVSLSHLNW